MKSPEYFAQIMTGKNLLELPVEKKESSSTRHEPYIPPETPVQQRLIDIWSRITGIEKIGINDNFFRLGGNSLKATQLISAIYKEFHVECKMEDIFDYQTAAQQAGIIENAAKCNYSRIIPVEKKEYYCLSSANRRVFFWQQLKSDITAYNEPQVFILKGSIQRDKLTHVFRRLIRRHESLRTSFIMKDGEPVQQVNPFVDFQLEVNNVNLPGLQSPKVAPGIQAYRQIAEQVIHRFIRSFNLSQAPLFRAGLMPVTADVHLLMLDNHHIISDGISRGILVNDFFKLYRDEELPPLILQYKDYAEWQQSPSGREKMKQEETFWLNYLGSEIPQLNLPVDFPRPPVQGFVGKRFHVELDNNLTASIKAYVAGKGITLHIFLLAAYYILLAKYTSQDDIVVGTLAGGRTHPDLLGITGIFVNMLPLRNTPARDKLFVDFLEEVKNNALDAYQNQDYPFQDLVRELGLKWNLCRHPLVETVFTLQNMGMENIKSVGFEVEPFPFDMKTAHYDLLCEAFDLDDTIEIIIEYSTVLFKKITVVRMSERFKEILHQVSENIQIKIKDIRISHEGAVIQQNLLREDAGDFEF